MAMNFLDFGSSSLLQPSHRYRRRVVYSQGGLAMNLLTSLKPSSPIGRASLFCALVLPLLGAGNDSPARYELVKIFDKSSKAPRGDEVRLAIRPQIVSADNIAFIAHVEAGPARAKEQRVDPNAQPAKTPGATA